MVAAVRLRRIQGEVGELLELDWRSFLLRPERGERPRTLDEFRRYTQSWLRPAATEPEAGFHTWQSDEGPPSHSVPPHLVAKNAARLSDEAFEAVHEALLDAYFRQSRDITAEPVLRDIWAAADLPAERFDDRHDPEIEQQVFGEHLEAIEQGANGVPAVRHEDGFGVVMGAQPEEVYRRWIDKLAAGEAT